MSRQLLLRDGTAVALRPKAWALLMALLKRPNAVVTTAELLDAIWPRQDIDPKQLVNVASELRIALGAGGALRTVHRRGLLLAASPAAGPSAQPMQPTSCQPVSPASNNFFVGRSRELRVLRDALSLAWNRQCQSIEIKGEAGMGKSALLAHWLSEVKSSGAWTILMGRALDLVGETEPFGPLIPMIMDHCQSIGEARAVQDLQRWAPCWLAQWPGLMSSQAVNQVLVEVYQSGEGRMRREGVDLILHWSAEKPLLLVLEDLQWADASTLDFLALLQQRAERRAVVIVTTRRLPSISGPRAPSLSGRVRDVSLAARHNMLLRGFDLEDVRAYFEGRLPHVPVRDEVLRQLWQDTSGLPLFLRAIVDEFESDGGQSPAAELIEPPIVRAVRQLGRFIVERAAGLSPDLRALMDVACCMAEPVPVPVLSFALDRPEADVQSDCEQLVHIGLFSPDPRPVSWQGQRVVKAYGLAHGLYREALFSELPADLMMVLSRRIASALQSHLEGPASVLPSLTPLYERLGMHEEAAAALRVSGLRSLGRFSTRHAIQAMQASLSQLEKLPDQPETWTLQLEACWDLSRISMIEHGPTHERVEQFRDKIEQLASRVGTPRAGFLQQVTRCARFVYGGRADLAQDSMRQALRASVSLGSHAQAVAQLWRGSVFAARGELAEAASAFTACLDLPLSGLGVAGLDARALASAQRAWTLGITGQIDEFQRGVRILDLEVDATRSAYLRVTALFWVSDALRSLGCFEAAKRRFGELLNLCTQYDSAKFLVQAQIGLHACEKAGRRDLAALALLFSSARGERPVWSDHLLSMVTIDAMIAQGYLDEARELLDRTRDIALHWPFYLPERLRLEGRLAEALGQQAQGFSGWRKALRIDLQRGYLPGVLRYLRRYPYRECLAEDFDHVLTPRLLVPLLKADLEDADLRPLRNVRDAIVATGVQLA